MAASTSSTTSFRSISSSTMNVLLLVGLVHSSSVSVTAPRSGFETTSVGNQLHRDYGVYASMPTTQTQAVSAGWVAKGGSTQCILGLGIEYVQSAQDDASKPLSLYFTPGGQLTGAGVFALGPSKPKLIKSGFWLPNGTLNGYDRYYASVSFRNAADSCSATQLPEPIGSELILNAGGVNMTLPMTRDLAKNSGWIQGSCFATMGTHWFYDLAGTGAMSWEAENLLPIVVMYDQESTNADNEINAIFFATPDRQQTALPPSANQWEPIPLPNFAMCKNFCDSKCTFTDTSAFSTLHLFFKNSTQVTCDGGCLFGCCSK